MVAYAFVRLQTGSAGFFWAGANVNPIQFTINEIGSDDIPDLSDEAAIRMSFQSWAAQSGTTIEFTEVGGSDRVDWPSTDIHLVYFDETRSSSYFQNNAGLVAVTPITFAGNGQILDADILFNGDVYRFSTDQSAGTYDVQSIGTHEVGHFIGLDHSGTIGATMYPFSLPQEIRLRSLAADDVSALHSVYPDIADGAHTGIISGRVAYGAGGGVREAHVVAVNSLGDPVSAVLSLSNGNFSITGLPTGSYTVYAEPLDGPVQRENFYERQPALDFGTTFLGGNINPTSVFVTDGATTPVGDIVTGSPSGRNLTGINRFQVVVGAPNDVIYVYGMGLQTSDNVRISGGDVEVLASTIGMSGTYIQLTLSVSNSAAPGLRNIEVSGPTGMAILTGGIEVIDSGPLVTSNIPTSVSTSGGESITILGTNFQQGAQVAIGGGVAQNVTITGGGSQLFCQTPIHIPGTYDLTVVNPDGQEASLFAAVTFQGQAPPPLPEPQGVGGGSSGGASSCILNPGAPAIPNLFPFILMMIAIFGIRFLEF